MAVEVKRCGGSAVLPLSFRRSLSPFPCGISFQNMQPPSQLARRFFTLAVVKRSPKRLKYSAPRFTKDDGLLYVDVDPFGSDAWKLDPIVELLKEGAVGVIPTDTVYAIACDLRSHSAIDRLRSLSASYAALSRILIHTQPDFLVATVQVLQTFFELLNIACRVLKELPKQCTRYGTTTSKYAPRKNVGVRIPDDAVCQAILEKMDAPLISTSVKSPKENEWILDPVVIADVYGPEGLDFVVDAGIRVADPSTVVDMTGNSPRTIRQGKGPKQPWMIAEDEDSNQIASQAS
ncbi:uncharacterized protein LOC111373951 isoform X2 [Olea europaea var. sylvestris]|uniref:uncharacterized protein LOC111373951 isoform X2 n=1 Tax=Olea europaea var. sylvestris TaxID=158386 RepID=UPI000C1CDD5B|nr:uncharacterized protein LOC111373951 isoform X2 [Olea europaea var. sylvestris]